MILLVSKKLLMLPTREYRDKPDGLKTISFCTVLVTENDLSFSCAYLLKINITFLYLSPLSLTFTWNINALTFNNIFLKAIGESLSIYQPTVTQLNQESERLHNSGQSIDARRIMDITTKYEILQDQVTHQRKKIHKELVLQQQCQSQSEHVESLLSECKGNLEKVDHQETGEKMKTLKVKKLLNYIF